MTLKDKTLKSLMASAALVAFTVSALPVSALQDDGKKPEAEKPAEKPAEKKADKKDDGKKDEKAKPKKKKGPKTIADATKKMKAKDGLFKLYESEKTGALKMEVRDDQLNQEFIYQSVAMDGVVEGGNFRGQYRANAVVKMVKVRETIELYIVNTGFYFDKDKAISKSASANLSDSLVAVLKIEANAKDKKSYLVDIGKLFKGTSLDPITANIPRPPRPGEFRLGKVNPKKTKITEAKNFKDNTAIQLDYVLTNPRPTGSTSSVADPRNVTLSLQHAFVRMPKDNGFIPRFTDPRVGYFQSSINDMTDRSATPWRDVVNRWDLQKKDPSAAVSEVKEPIVWWIENTTPREYRDVIRDATLAWNIAFEEAGLKNAIVVKVQPDDAEWEADDINYNVLRWTSSPRPPFGGYGPSFTNPRTGQILGADIMLEYGFLTNRMNASDVFENALMTQPSDNSSDASAVLSMMDDHAKYCNLSQGLQMNNMLGQTLAATQGRSEDAKKQLIIESIYYLILHEVGHTLGLNHNMKATQARAFDEVNDIDKQDDGLAGSVMDYPAINFAPKGEDQGRYYTITPGHYDKWAIKFAYSPDMEDAAKRKALLEKSTDPLLAFGNDADDMRAPGKAIDPRVNIYDMSDDAIKFAETRLEMNAVAMGELKDRVMSDDADSYQKLRNSYLILTGDSLWQGRVVSRYIGGIYVDRAAPGQKGATAPYRPVEEDRQKAAMSVLRQHIFAPTAMMADKDLISHLAIKRRGFAHFPITEDPKLLQRVWTAQRDILSHVLHPNTLLRISDTQMYGNTYDAATMMNDLTKAVFEDDMRTAVNEYRQNLQIGYVNMLIGLIGSKQHDPVAKSSALYQLTQIRKDMDRARTRDISTKAHRAHVSLLIDKALEVSK